MLGRGEYNRGTWTGPLPRRAWISRPSGRVPWVAPGGPPRSSRRPQGSVRVPMSDDSGGLRTLLRQEIPDWRRLSGPEYSAKCRWTMRNARRRLRV